MSAPAKYVKKFGSERANKIYRRGLGAYYSSGSRPKMSPHQWAVARLKAHAEGRASVKKADGDLFRKKKG
jgi:hypothetical protein|tara:strand:- start:310 stop:519 length:210 start_codon:yes stop_codon:yes gene_type:complete